MRNGAPTIAAAPTAAEVCTHYTLGEEAKKLLRSDLTAVQYLDLLLAGQQHLDAVRFLAHALPKREAVWWACLCARQVCGAEAPAPMTAALGAAEKWVAEPSEDHRRAALPAAEAAT